MAIEVTPTSPGIPATSGIEDPAARVFAQAVADTLRTMQSATNAVQTVTTALSALAPGTEGGTATTNEADLINEILKSELYAVMIRAINRIGVPDATRELIEGLQSGLNQERIERSTSLEATTSQLDSAVSRIGDNEAAIAQVQTTVANELEAVVTDVSVMNSQVGANTSGLSREIAARTTSEAAIIRAINTMWGTVGTNSALIQDGSAVNVNFTAAQANKWGTIQAEVLGSGGQTIRQALSQESTARANLAGDLSSTWTVRADSNGVVSGIGFGTQGSGLRTTSYFNVMASRFAIIDPNNKAYVPFLVDSTTGAVYMNHAFIKKISLVGSDSFSAASAVSGARMEMNARVIKVFDSTGTCRVKIGDLSA
jgi:hypothetical protein